MENDMNVIPMKGIIELSNKISDCDSNEIDNINDFLNTEFIEVVLKRESSQMSSCITKHLNLFANIDNISNLDENTLKNNISNIPDGDISDLIVGNIDQVISKIDSINEKIDKKPILTITNSSNIVNIKSDEEFQTFTVKVKNNKVDLTLQITDGILFQNNNTENSQVSVQKVNTKEFNLIFSDLDSGTYNLETYIEGNLTTKTIDFINGSPEKFKVFSATLLNNTISSTEENAKIRITWTDSVSTVDHYEILGTKHGAPSFNDIIESNIPVGTQTKDIQIPAGGTIDLAVAAVTSQGIKTICQADNSTVPLNLKVIFSESTFEKLVRYYGNMLETGDIYMDDILKIEFFANFKLPSDSYPLGDKISSYHTNPEASQTLIQNLSNFTENDLISSSAVITDIKFLTNLKELFLIDISTLVNIIGAPNKSSTPSFPDEMSGFTSLKKLVDLKTIITSFFLNGFDFQNLENSSNIKNIISLYTPLDNYDFINDFTNLETYFYLLTDDLPMQIYPELLIDESSNTNKIKKFFIGGKDLNITVSNIEKISFMTNLESLVINGLKLTDISFLNTLENLDHLTLFENGLTNISPLKNLRFNSLSLRNNNITDFTPLIENEFLENSQADIYINTDNITTGPTSQQLTDYIGKAPHNNSIIEVDE